MRFKKLIHSKNEFSVAISLGVDCRVKYQIARYQYENLGDRKPAQSFNKVLSTGGGAASPEGTFFFDWFVTPPSSVARLLECRFEGFFERQNLEINSNGYVVDGLYNVTLPHAFHKKNGKVSVEALDAGFDDESRKMKYLAEKTLDHICYGGPTVYISAGGGSMVQLERIAQAISRLSTSEFHVLGVRAADSTKGIVENTENVSVYVMDRDVRKPKAARWQGDDEHWSAMLGELPVFWHQ